MSSFSETPRNPRFIKPPNILKQKVGSGGVAEKTLEKAQRFVEQIEFDFAPYAEEYLRELNEAIIEIQKGKLSDEQALEKVVRPIMQLKANGGMFRFSLVSEIGDIALQFMEAVESVNEDTIEVLKAHEKTLRVIVQNRLRGDGGREGYALVKELDQACKRYFSRYKKSA